MATETEVYFVQEILDAKKALAISLKTSGISNDSSEELLGNVQRKLSILTRKRLNETSKHNLHPNEISTIIQQCIQEITPILPTDENVTKLTNAYCNTIINFIINEVRHNKGLAETGEQTKIS